MVNLTKIVHCFQISTLVSHRERSLCSDRSLRALARVGQSVNLAVERFVTVGEKIADDNTEVKQDMYEACKEARAAGERRFIYFFNFKNSFVVLVINNCSSPFFSSSREFQGILPNRADVTKSFRSSLEKRVFTLFFINKANVPKLLLSRKPKYKNYILESDTSTLQPIYRKKSI